MKSHMKSKTKTYNSWMNLKQRCLNPKNPKFKYYGGRGIKVCNRWLDSFDNFFKDMGEVPPKGSIERINNNGDYSPENCRWATSKEQSSNRRSNKFITHNGETLGICEWSQRLGGSVSLITYRLQRGWDPIEAITTPPDLGNRFNRDKNKIYG
jgi:hypothetical protein